MVKLGGGFRVVISGKPFKYSGKEMIELDGKSTYISFTSRKDVYLDDALLQDTFNV